MPGGFRCDCRIGFTLDPLTSACEDINECQINNHECLDTQRCDNTIGSYRCIRTQSCGTGYTFNAETQNCEGRKFLHEVEIEFILKHFYMPFTDDDECALGRHNCFDPYECHNTKGKLSLPTSHQSTGTFLIVFFTQEASVVREKSGRQQLWRQQQPQLPRELRFSAGTHHRCMVVKTTETTENLASLVLREIRLVPALVRRPSPSGELCPRNQSSLLHFLFMLPSRTFSFQRHLSFFKILSTRLVLALQY